MFAVCNKCITLLLADATLRFGMYPADKVAIFQHLVTPRFPQGDHTTSSVQMLVHFVVKYSRPPDLKSSHLLGLQVHTSTLI